MTDKQDADVLYECWDPEAPAVSNSAPRWIRLKKTLLRGAGALSLRVAVPVERRRGGEHSNSRVSICAHVLR